MGLFDIFKKKSQTSPNHSKKELSPKELRIIKSPQKVLKLLREFENGNEVSKDILLGIDLKKLQDLKKTKAMLLSIEILSEFKLMFSFKPGQRKGLRPLIELTEYGIEQLGGSEWIYNHPGWGQLLQLRSSFHSLEVRLCGSCGNEYPHEVIGDFANIAMFNCTHCFCAKMGHLIAVDKHPVCSRGYEQVFDQCPHCYSQEIKSQRWVSGYEYFYDKKFGDGLAICCMDT